MATELLPPAAPPKPATKPRAAAALLSFGEEEEEEEQAVAAPRRPPAGKRRVLGAMRASIAAPVEQVSTQRPAAGEYSAQRLREVCSKVASLRIARLTSPRSWRPRSAPRRRHCSPTRQFAPTSRSSSSRIWCGGCQLQQVCAHATVAGAASLRALGRGRGARQQL